MSQKLKDINLLPSVKRPQESTPYLIIISMFLVLGFFIFLGVQYFLTNSQLKAAEEEYARLEENIEILQEELDKKQAQDSDKPTLADAVNFAEGHYIPSSIFIEELFDLLPDNTYFSEYDYRTGDTNIELHMETLDSIASYTAKLKGSPYIKDTKLNDVESFTLKEQEDIDPYEEIPRYNVKFTLMIDPLRLKEAEHSNE